MRRLPATAKLNLALVAGPRRPDGKHEVATVLQRIDLADRVSLEPAPALRVIGFEDDTLVRRALERVAEEAGVAPRWSARIWKKIPVAAGLGGGSSDAATALRLVNETLPEPLTAEVLTRIAAELGADVPFFLVPGPQLGEGAASGRSSRCRARSPTSRSPRVNRTTRAPSTTCRRHPSGRASRPSPQPRGGRARTRRDRRR